VPCIAASERPGVEAFGIAAKTARAVKLLGKPAAGAVVEFGGPLLANRGPPGFGADDFAASFLMAATSKAFSAAAAAWAANRVRAYPAPTPSPYSRLHCAMVACRAMALYCSCANSCKSSRRAAMSAAPEGLMSRSGRAASLSRRTERAMAARPCGACAVMACT
jgi:hypothetical protein